MQKGGGGDRNPKFGVWLHLVVAAECHIPFLGHCDLDLNLNNGVQSILPILFDIGIPNLVCGYVLGSQTVPNCFLVTVTLTWPHFLKMYVWSIITCIILVRDPKFGLCMFPVPVTFTWLHAILEKSCWEHLLHYFEGAQWLSGRVLDSRPRGRGFEPYLHHCVVSLSKTH